MNSSLESIFEFNEKSIIGHNFCSVKEQYKNKHKQYDAEDNHNINNNNEWDLNYIDRCLESSFSFIDGIVWTDNILSSLIPFAMGLTITDSRKRKDNVERQQVDSVHDRMESQFGFEIISIQESQQDSTEDHHRKTENKNKNINSKSNSKSIHKIEVLFQFKDESNRYHDLLMTFTRTIQEQDYSLANFKKYNNAGNTTSTININQNKRLFETRTWIDEDCKISLSFHLPSSPSGHHQHLQEFMMINDSYSHDLPMLIMMVLKTFKERIKDYQSFWNVMDDLDHRFYTQTSSRHPREDTTRRIVIHDRLNLFIELNPRYPQKKPIQLKLHGEDVHEYLIERLDSILNDHTDDELNEDRMDEDYDYKWNSLQSCVENLERILNIEFKRNPNIKNQSTGIPSGNHDDDEDNHLEDKERRSATVEANDCSSLHRKQEKEEEQKSCGICYGPTLKNLINKLQESQRGERNQETEEEQIVLCENEKCHQEYHFSCLMEWIRSSEMSINMFSIKRHQGQCVYCQHDICL